MSVPAFIDLTEANQTLELREYLKGIGADLSLENAESLSQDIEDIINASQSLWKQGEDKDIEGTVNSILSLLFVIPPNQCSNLIHSLCEQLEQGGNDGRVALVMRLFHNLFHGFDIKNSFLFETFCSWIKVASNHNCIDQIKPNLEQVTQWLDQWGVNDEQRRESLHLLHKAQITAGNSEEASKTMNQLLGDCSDDSALQAKEEANKCIVTALSDPKTFLYDHLLNLKPVETLKGEKIYDLLNIFVSGSLQNYMDFYTNNREFCDSINIDHETCLRKIRLLTFVDLVSSRKVITFDEIKTALCIEEDAIEEFIIDAIQSNMITGKLDNLNKKVMVSHAVRRTFAMKQWDDLDERLDLWRTNITMVESHLRGLDQDV